MLKQTSVHALLGQAVQRALQALPLLPGRCGVRRRLGAQCEGVLAGQLPQVQDEVLRLPLCAVHLRTAMVCALGLGYGAGLGLGR